MARLLSLLRTLVVLSTAALGAACATIPADAGSNPVDPWERYNRQMFDINDRVDRAVLKPVAQAYAAVVPQPARDCVTNIFANINDVPNAFNNLLQGKPGRAVSDICRVAINTTVGLLGCFDVASKVGLEKSDEDFGQTLGVWGMGTGAYIVWPLFGPSSVRDTIGLPLDMAASPSSVINDGATRYSLTALNVVNTRANLLGATRVLDDIALDKYTFIRDAYIARRRNLVYDGDPPEEPSDPEPAPK